MKNRRMLALILIMVFMVLGVAGCSSSELEDRVEADGTPKVEAMLLAFNEGEYEAFIKDFGPVMLEAVTQEVFEDQLRPAIRDIIGDYEEGSLSLAKATEENEADVDYLAAIYRSSFTDEEGVVTVTILFTDDEEMKIETFVLSSPKLIEAAN